MNSLIHNDIPSMCWTTESLSTPSSSDAEDDNDTEYGDTDIKLEDPFSMLSNELDEPGIDPMLHMKLHTRTSSLTQPQNTKIMPAMVGARRHASDGMVASNKNVSFLKGQPVGRKGKFCALPSPTEQELSPLDSLTLLELYTISTNF